MVKQAEKTLGICCPIFETERWDQKEFTWVEKKFLKGSVPTFFHIPFPPMIGKRLEGMMETAEKANALDEDRLESLLLWKDPSAFKTEMYFSVNKEIDVENLVKISGQFKSRVFTGNYRDVPRFIDNMKEDLEKQGIKPKDFFVHYAYCPKCTKEAGHNFVVVFAQV